jgi:hypothetical protein
MLKTRPKQLLGSLPVSFALPAAAYLCGAAYSNPLLTLSTYIRLDSKGTHDIPHNDAQHKDTQHNNIKM